MNSKGNVLSAAKPVKDLRDFIFRSCFFLEIIVY